jgi:hypothetical protein
MLINGPFCQKDNIHLARNGYVTQISRVFCLQFAMICLLGCKQNEGAQQNTEGEVRLATGHTHHAETKMGREQFLLRLGRIHILFCGVFSHVFQHWPCFLSRECYPKRSSLRQCERTSGRAATSLQRMLSRGGEQWMDNIKPPAQVHWSCLSTSHSNWAYQYNIVCV